MTAKEVQPGTAVQHARLILDLFLQRIQLTLSEAPYGTPAAPGSLYYEESMHPSLSGFLARRQGHLHLLGGGVWDHASLTLRATGDPPIPHGAWTSFRVFLEQSAWYFWLQDPGGDPERRVLRFLLMEANSLQETHKALAHVGPEADDPAFQADLLRRIELLRAEALKAGFKMERKGRHWLVNGEPLPSATGIIEQELNHHMLYRIASGVMHGGKYALDFVRGTSFHRSYVAMLDSTACILHDVIEARCLAFGWPTEVLGGVYEELNRILERILDHIDGPPEGNPSSSASP